MVSLQALYQLIHPPRPCHSILYPFTVLLSHLTSKTLSCLPSFLAPAYELPASVSASPDTALHPIKKQTVVGHPPVHCRSLIKIHSSTFPQLQSMVSSIPQPVLGGCSNRGLQREHGVAILWLPSALWWVECISSGIDSWKGTRSRGGATVLISASAASVLSTCCFLHSEPRCVLQAVVLYLRYQQDPYCHFPPGNLYISESTNREPPLFLPSWQVFPDSCIFVFLCSSDAGVTRNVHAQKRDLQSGAGECWACGPKQLSSRCLEDRKRFLALFLLSLLPRGICFIELKFAANEARVDSS